MKEKASGKKATLRDVANDVGVSISVVSRVLRNKRKRVAITDRTRRRILESALRFGIRLNDNIGVFIPSSMMDYDLIHYPFIAGIFEEATRSNLGVHSHAFKPGNASHEIPAFLENRNIRGAVFLSETPKFLVDFLDDNLIPYVLADIGAEPLERNCVSIDYEKTTKSLLACLHAMGYSEYILVFNEAALESMPKFERIELEVFNDFISATPNIGGEVVFRGGSLEKDMTFLAKKVETATKSTVFIVDSRLHTVELLKLFAKSSLTVSKDVGLVGSHLLSEHCEPKFISLKYDFHGIAVEAVRLLNRIMDDSNRPKPNKVLPGTILR